MHPATHAMLLHRMEPPRAVDKMGPTDRRSHRQRTGHKTLRSVRRQWTSNTSLRGTRSVMAARQPSASVLPSWANNCWQPAPTYRYRSIGRSRLQPSDYSAGFFLTVIDRARRQRHLTQTNRWTRCDRVESGQNSKVTNARARFGAARRLLGWLVVLFPPNAGEFPSKLSWL
jgi:hypothetical protein